MPIASYSGSYQPAPSPTSTRPPLTRSSVASALARIDAGRSASQNTSVPSRTSGTQRAERGQRDDRVVAPLAVGRAAVLREVEEQVVGQPDRIEAGVACGARRTRRSCRSGADAHRRPSSRTAAARARGASVEGYPPARRSYAERMLECVVNVAEGRDRDGPARDRRRERTGAARRPHRHATITARCSRWPVRATRMRSARLDRSPEQSKRACRSADTTACTRSSVHSTSCRSSDCTQPTRNATSAVHAAREFGAWWAETHGVPVFLYDDADPSGRDLPRTRREAFTTRRPDFGPDAPHPHARCDRGRRAPSARRDQRVARDRRPRARPPHRRRRARARRRAPRRAGTRPAARDRADWCRYR